MYFDKPKLRNDCSTCFKEWHEFHIVNEDRSKRIPNKEGELQTHIKRFEHTVVTWPVSH